jgi:hypothetical protein
MGKKRRGKPQKPRRWPRLAYTPFAGEDRRNNRRLLIITLVITTLAILGLWYESTLPDPPPTVKPEEPVKVSLIVPPPGMFEIPAAFEVEAAAPKPVHARRRSRPGRRPDLTRTRAPSDSVYVPEDARADRIAATWDDEDDDEETTHGERVAKNAPPAPPPPPFAPTVAPARSPAAPAAARQPARKPTHASRRVTVVTEPKPHAQPKPRRRPRPVGRRPNPDNVVIVGSGGTELEELNAQPIEP